MRSQARFLVKRHIFHDYAVIPLPEQLIHATREEVFCRATRAKTTYRPTASQEWLNAVSACYR